MSASTYAPTDESVCNSYLPDGRMSSIRRYKGLNLNCATTTQTVAGSTIDSYSSAGALIEQTITTPRPLDVASSSIGVERRYLIHDAAGDVVCTRRTFDESYTPAPTACSTAKPYVAAHPEQTKTQEWWKLTVPCQIPQKERKAGEHWMSLKEVFHAD